MPDDQTGAVAPVAAPQQLRNIGEELTDAWQIYASRFWKLLAINLVAVATFLLVALVIGGTVIVKVFVLGQSPEALMGLVTTPTFWVAVLIGLLIVLTVGFWSSVSLIVAVSAEQQAPSFAETYRRAWPLIGAMAWAGLLSALAATVGFILLFVPGIILLVRYIFVALVVVLEGQRGRAALRTSAAYVKGRWWAIAGRLALVYFGLLIISVLASRVGGGGLQMVVNLITQPFMLAFLYVVYRDARAIKTA